MLIDTFINAIFLYDDKMVITFNYKEGTDTVTFDDLKASPAAEKSGSDMDCLTAPSYANTLDAVGATPTASTLSWIFILEIFTNKTIDANHRLAGIEPAHNHFAVSALFEHGRIQKGGLPLRA